MRHFFIGGDRHGLPMCEMEEEAGEDTAAGWIQGRCSGMVRADSGGADGAPHLPCGGISRIRLCGLEPDFRQLFHA